MGNRIKLIILPVLLAAMWLATWGDTAEYTFHWTAPYDNVAVIGYEIRACFVSDTSDFDWDNPDLRYPLSIVPQAPGSAEQYPINDLPFETPLVFTIRSFDGEVNWSVDSNKLYLFFEDSQAQQHVKTNRISRGRIR